jgi:hypothetical protein
MPTAQDVFDQSVRPLPLRERLQLAALILQDLARDEVQVVEQDDSWSEQDMREVVAFSLRYAETAYPEDEELV